MREEYGFYHSGFVLDFLVFPSLVFPGLALLSGASVSRIFMVGNTLDLALDEESNAEMKHINLKFSSQHARFPGFGYSPKKIISPGL